MIIRIKDLRLRTLVGDNEWETRKAQDVTVNVEFEYDAHAATESDDMSHAVNYKEIKHKIITLVEEGHFRLLETLADRVLKIVIEDEKVIRARVEVDKPHALRFADSVSATATWEKQA